MSRFERYPFSVGEHLTLKKAHPCGHRVWVVDRVGAEIRIICQGCGHAQSMLRSKLERALTKIDPPTTSSEDNNGRKPHA